MSKTEKFISDCTRNCSNYTGVINKKTCEGYYVPWLTPDQARKAVEIAREEIYEWLRVNLCNYFDAPRNMFEMCLDDLKQAMKDE